MYFCTDFEKVRAENTVYERTRILFKAHNNVLIISHDDNMNKRSQQRVKQWRWSTH